MAATALSDPYTIFMRKIGYSVGLEHTLQRVEDLAALYLRTGDLTVPGWRELVRSDEHWGLKTEHIADVFCSLQLIQRTPGDVLVLENLDAMAIASELLADVQHRRAARTFLLLWAILVNDGEIFVNLLLADFEEERIKETLRAVLRQKRATLGKILKGRETAKRISRVITIEYQANNAGGASVARSVAPTRTEIVRRERKKISSGSGPDDFRLSEDYFRKVPPKRKDWARTLGLWEDRVGLTARGKNFVEGLKKAGYIDARSLFTYWPMDHELVRAGFRPDLLGADTKKLWDCLLDFAGAYAGVRVKRICQSDADETVTLIGAMMGVFRNLHVRKTLLRRELPITVAYPAAVACACATQARVIDLPTAISAEQKGEKRRLALRRSRNTGGALSLKK